MFPFFPSPPNQIQAQAGKDPALQQTMQFTHLQFPSPSPSHQNPTGFNRPPQSPLPHGQNPQFPTPTMTNFYNQNTHINNFHGNNTGIPNRPNRVPSPCFPNAPNLPPMNPPVRQFSPQISPHNVNQVIAALQVLQHNIPQMLCAPNMHLGQQYQTNSMQSLNPPSSQPSMASTNFYNPCCVGNPQMGLANLNSNFSNSPLSNEAMRFKNLDPLLFTAPCITVQSAIQGSPAATQNSQPSMLPFPMEAHQNWNNMQPNVHQRPQANYVHGYIKSESSNARFQKSQFHHMKNTKGNMGSFTKNGGRGQGQRIRGERIQLTECSKQTQVEERRPLPVYYTENEICKWREVGKKNIPCRTKIEKLAVRGGDQKGADGDSNLRRQQPDEGLAEQAKLGIEVAQIPPSCLTQPQEQINKQRNERKAWSMDGRLPKKSNKRGKRSHGTGCSKKPKIGNEAPTTPIVTVKTEPTLLQKLASTDLERDRSWLLQAFKFMVLNSFFEHWPNKPLEFQSATVKDTGSESNDITVKNGPTMDEADAGNGAMDEETEARKDQTVVGKNDGDDDDDDDGDDGDGDDEVANRP